MKNIAIFASGSGSNAENLIRYFNESNSVRVTLVISNKKEAYVVERAHCLNVPCKVFAKDFWIDGKAILDVLQTYQIDWIVLAGFLLRVPPCLLQAYSHRIVNIHPALLPQFGGKGMYGMRVHEAVVAAGESQTGITIHYINEQYDEGDVIFQVACPVLPTDTPEDVAAKVHALEYEYYPKVVAQLVQSSLQ